MRQALPNWAQQTLARHAGDARHVMSMQQLEAGTTGDRIWDAMQHQLNITGAHSPCAADMHCTSTGLLKCADSHHACMHEVVRKLQ